MVLLTLIARVHDGLALSASMEEDEGVCVCVHLWQTVLFAFCPLSSGNDTRRPPDCPTDRWFCRQPPICPTDLWFCLQPPIHNQSPVVGSVSSPIRHWPCTRTRRNCCSGRWTRLRPCAAHWRQTGRTSSSKGARASTRNSTNAAAHTFPFHSLLCTGAATLSNLGCATWCCARQTTPSASPLVT